MKWNNIDATLTGTGIRCSVYKEAKPEFIIYLYRYYQVHLMNRLCKNNNNDNNHQPNPPMLTASCGGVVVDVDGSISTIYPNAFWQKPLAFNYYHITCADHTTEFENNI